MGLVEKKPENSSGFLPSKSETRAIPAGSIEICRLHASYLTSLLASRPTA